MRVAVLGATGSVGRAIVQLLDERTFPVRDVVALGSSASVGRQLSMGDTTLTVQAGDNFDFSSVDLVFSATSSEVAKRLLPRAREAGAWIIDKSSAFRMSEKIPLVIPEVNKDLMTSETTFVASPNCVVIPLMLALAPLHQEAQLKRVVISTYQSTSGAGKKGMDELYSQARSILMTDQPKIDVFQHQIAFNVIPQIGECDGQGWSEEENKIQEESCKILQLPDLGVVVTSVRVPVFIGHAFSVAAEFINPLSSKEARAIWGQTEGIRVLNQKNPIAFEVTPLGARNEDEVFIARVREDKSVSSGLCFWVTCDNLRKGAALNAVQIAEEMLRFHS